MNTQTDKQTAGAPETRNWQEHQRAVQLACKKILNGTWKLINSTIVDSDTHYAVQQYRDEAGLIQTATFTREGNLLTITA